MSRSPEALALNPAVISFRRRYHCPSFGCRLNRSRDCTRSRLPPLLRRRYADPPAGASFSCLRFEAVTQALPHIGPTELEQIKAAQQAFENAVARGSKADQANTNAAFHDEIYRHAPNRSLAKLVVEKEAPELWVDLNCLPNAYADFLRYEGTTDIERQFLTSYNRRGTPHRSEQP
jgi:hypothetical protein